MGFAGASRSASAKAKPVLLLLAGLVTFFEEHDGNGGE
jgi:hypothetical protein